jgi:hypothetical protein
VPPSLHLSVFPTGSPPPGALRKEKGRPKPPQAKSGERETLEDKKKDDIGRKGSVAAALLSTPA